jgi:Flp pilus assembly protein TadD
MNTQQQSDRQPGNAVSRSRTATRIVAGLVVAAACGGIATTVAAPDEPKDADPAEQKKKDDAFVERFRRAQRLMGRGADEEAEKLFRELISEKPDEGSLHHALGLLLQFRKRPDEATKELLLASKLAPDEPVIQRDTGMHLFAQGKPADAEPYLATAAKLWPEDVETAVSRGAVLRALGRGAEAEKEYRRATVSDPNSVDAAVGLAACIVDRDPGTALSLVEKATGQWPDVLLVRGVANVRLAHYDVAAEALSNVVAAAPPGQAGLLFVRSAAEALVQCGAAKPAAAAAQKWFDTESAAGAPSASACRCLAEARAANGDAKGALDAIAAGPKDVTAETSLLRAALLVRTGRADDAKAAIEALASAPAEGFERSAARFLAGKLSFADFDKLSTEPGRANDVAWVESVACEINGDATGAAAARIRAADASKPPGEFPGLVVRAAPAK